MKNRIHASALAAALACYGTTANAAPQEIFEETFNYTGSSVVSDYGWSPFVSDSGTGLITDYGTATSALAVSSNNYLFYAPKADTDVPNDPALVSSPLPDSYDISELISVQWESSSDNVDHAFRVVVQVGGVWYASSDTFNDGAPDSGLGGPYLPLSFDPVDPFETAANWLAIQNATLGATAPLSLGAAPGSDLSGEVEAVGLYLVSGVDNEPDGDHVRFRNFSVIADVPLLTWASGDANWTAANVWEDDASAPATFVDGIGVLFEDSLSTGDPIIVTLNDTVIPSSIDIDSTKDYTITGSGMISGPALLTKSGTGTLTLATANDHSGGIDLLGGTLNINNASALGTGTFTIEDDTTINNTSGGAIVNTDSTPISWNAPTANPFTFTGTHDLDLGPGTVNLNFDSRAVDVVAGNLTFGGPVTQQGGATRSLTKLGAGTLTIVGETSYLGNTIVSEGTLANGSFGAFVGNGGDLDVDAGGTFDLNGFDALFTSLTDDDDVGTITNSAGGDPALMTFLNTNDDDNAGKSAIFTGNLILEFANTNSGATMWGLSSSNDFTGGLVLLDGSGIGNGSGTRLRINATISGTPLGTGPITIGLNDTDKAGILLDTVSNTLANDIVFNTTLGSDVPGIRFDTSGNVLSGQITADLADATFASGNTNTGSVSLTGKITGPSGLALTPPGSATTSTITVTLNNAAMDNDYVGDTTISQVASSDYILSLGAADQIPNGAGTGNVINDGTLDLNTFSETINGLSGTGIVDTIAGGTPVLTAGDNDATSTFDGLIQNSAGTLALTKIGAGTLTLTGDNTYTGDTRVEAGALSLTMPYLADGADVYITSGATLDLAHGVADTIRNLYVDGILQPVDSYDNGSAFITGGGSLNVVGSGVPNIIGFALDGSGNAVITLDGPAAGLSVERSDDLTGFAFVVSSVTDTNELTVDSSLVDPDDSGRDFFRVTD